MATIERLTKRYGKRTVHQDLSLNIRRGERWCEMGKNGAGKSTLLKMVAGAVQPDEGHVTLGASLKMGYSSQQALDVLNADLTIEEQLQRDFPHESIGVLRSLAGAFQFSGDDIDKKIRMLSGGEKSRLVPARILLNPLNFLVLDEPTNHLDSATKEILLESLKGFDGTMLFVSHDREFLRALSTPVLELWGESGTETTPHAYPGSISNTSHGRVTRRLACIDKIRMAEGRRRCYIIPPSLDYEPRARCSTRRPRNRVPLLDMMLCVLASFAVRQ